MNQIVINQTAIQVKEYDGKRVVTFKDIDTVHERPEGTAKRNFRINRSHFIEGEDFYIVKPSDVRMDEFRTSKIQKDEFRPSEINNRGTTLITETGYLMLVKSFTDDLAWTVQRQLVNTYFQVKQMLDYESRPNTKLLTVKDYIHNTCKEFGMNEPIMSADLIHLSDVPEDYYLAKAWDALRLTYGFAPDSKEIIIDDIIQKKTVFYLYFHVGRQNHYFKAKFKKHSKVWWLSDFNHSRTKKEINPLVLSAPDGFGEDV